MADILASTSALGRTGRLAILAAMTVLAFSGGLLVGRQYPAHHYERFGASALLLDTSSGRVCDPFLKSQPSVKAADPQSSDPWEAAAAKLEKESPTPPCKP
jgi:hypothetical protein